jgi:signal transduction histidine kinase
MAAWAATYIEQHNESVESRMRRVQQAREEERREKEQEIYRLRNVELNSANERLQRANKELMELAAEKDEFMAIAAHDLRNPLADMRSMLQSVISHYDVLGKEDVLDVTRELLTTITRMGATVHAFLEISRTDKRSSGVSIDKLDLVHMAHSAVERHVGRAEGKGMKLVVVGDQVPWALGDPSIVDAVLDNLISNAIKYGPKGTTVTVTVGAEPQPPTHIVVRVHDQGPGIPEHERSRLFTKYARLSARPTGGEDSMGLGLYLAKRMAQRMNASLDYEDHPAGGSVFALKLPVA